jgi:spore coat protein CotH
MLTPAARPPGCPVHKTRIVPACTAKGKILSSPFRVRQFWHTFAQIFHNRPARSAVLSIAIAKSAFTLLTAFSLWLPAVITPAFAAELQIYPGAAFHVLGDQEDEWRFESTTNLVDWSDAPDLGTMFSDDRVRSMTNTSSRQFFLRAVQTKGIFDDRVLRTFHLSFAMTNWQTRLTSGRTTGSNTLCTVGLDNGLTNLTAGARYKGNSSFGIEPTKKSINLEFDFVQPDGRVMDQKTINLNNAAGDRTIMREPLYFNVMNEYAPSPKAALAKLYINGQYWGVYSMAQQENNVLIDEWFPSTDGDRWRTPNIGGQSAMVYLGPSLSMYRNLYDLRTDNSTNAWQRLTNAIYVLNRTTNNFRDRVDDVYAVDRWLWFLAVENVFADEDSYVRKGSDYSFYYEPESGRIHPIEHDGNEAFFPGDRTMSPVEGIANSERPMLQKLLGNTELKQRYLAHMRTILAERYHPSYLTPLIGRLHRLSAPHIAADTKKSFTMLAYTNELQTLRTFVTNRYQFLTNHAELRPLPPKIESVDGPEESPTASESAVITARISGSGTNGINSAWLYWRTKRFGKFTYTQMFDDGSHSDGAAGDGLYGASITNYPAGTLVRYYVEARSDNSVQTAVFSPARAEQVTYNYRVRLSDISDSPVVLNEFMAENTKTVADPQGEFEDWIELHNASAEAVDLTGMYLSDDPEEPRKWRFPDGTRIAAGGYLLVWADEDSSITEGVHANFKLSNDGEEIFLVDTDERENRLLDYVSFGKQGADFSHGRDPSAPSLFKDMPPSPGAANQQFPSNGLGI